MASLGKSAAGMRFAHPEGCVQGQDVDVTTVSEKAIAAERAPLALDRVRETIVSLWLDDGEHARTMRSALLAFSVRVVSAAILYLSQIVLARWMGSFQYGIYVFVWTWVLVLGGMSNLGLGMAMIRLLPEYRETKSLPLMRGLLRYGRLIAFGASTTVALLGLAGLHFFGSVFAETHLLPLYIGLVCLPMITLSDVQDGVGRGSGWMGVALLPPYVLRPLLVLVGMFAAHEFGWPMNAVTATAAAVISTWVTAAIQTFLVHRRFRAEVPKGPVERRPDLWLRTSLPLLVIGGAELLLQNTDVLIVSYFMKPDQVAIYFAAAKTMALVMFIHYAVGSAMAKRFSALNARGDQAALTAITRNAVNWTFWPSLAAAIGLLAMGKPLLWLFGPQFVAGYPVMFVLVLGFLGRAAMGPSEFLLNMLGQQKACAAVIASMAALNIVLQFIAIPLLGLMGAALATATCLILGAGLNTIVAKRRLGLDIAVWNNWRRG